MAPAARPAPELVLIDPPPRLGRAGADGPVRATIDVLVEPLAGSRSRLTVSAGTYPRPTL